MNRQLRRCCLGTMDLMSSMLAGLRVCADRRRNSRVSLTRATTKESANRLMPRLRSRSIELRHAVGLGSDNRLCAFSLFYPLLLLFLSRSFSRSCILTSYTHTRERSADFYIRRVRGVEREGRVSSRCTNYCSVASFLVDSEFLLRGCDRMSDATEGERLY